jgi:hypothetical protein
MCKLFLGDGVKFRPPPQRRWTTETSQHRRQRSHEMQCVLCDVETEFLNTIQMSFRSGKDELFSSPPPRFVWLQHALVVPAIAAANPGEPLAGTAMSVAPNCRHEPDDHKPSKSDRTPVCSGHCSCPHVCILSVVPYQFPFRYECCFGYGHCLGKVFSGRAAV